MKRTILVTGSAGGIGGAAAAQLRADGLHVVGLDLREAEVTANLADPAERDGLVDRILVASGGSLDAVVACAGVASADTSAMVAVNYFGTVALLDVLRPILASSNAPRAVVVTSSATILPISPPLVAACLAGDETQAQELASMEPGLVYASTKRALSRWVRRTSAHHEWAGAGVLLNGVAPGTVRTAMTARLLSSAEGRALLAEATPIGTADYASPEDIAPLLAFLASPQCRYLVGQVLFADGGKDVIRRGDDIWS
ncbi:SDR family oxidoreductase [Novosphingobium sp. ERN07]|uniref:SDR family oxidoreductase n=1 Tax=Novosphingobium sp. ERN07 TaxID=2726187 RepID=UPI001456AD17|nr:SDR family oxidoreductase [Novosphingobium sp. ERN07]